MELDEAIAAVRSYPTGITTVEFVAAAKRLADIAHEACYCECGKRLLTWCVGRSCEETARALPNVQETESS